MSTRLGEIEISDGLLLDENKRVKYDGVCTCPDNITERGN